MPGPDPAVRCSYPWWPPRRRQARQRRSQGATNRAAGQALALAAFTAAAKRLRSGISRRDVAVTRTFPQGGFVRSSEDTLTADRLLGRADIPLHVPIGWLDYSSSCVIDSATRLFALL